MVNKSNRKNRPRTINGVINKIQYLSKTGDYIYRGERKPYKRVSSAFYREYFDDKDIRVDIQGFDLRHVQREILHVAKKHIGETPQGLFEDFTGRTISKPRYPTPPEPQPIIDSDEIEILTELQHYGGKTNLIDFTTDYLIAIFFACAAPPTKDGRVIVLEKTTQIEKMIIHPYNPRHRVVAQKSVLLYPRDGFIDVPDENIVYIPADLKQPLLEFLRKYHNISPETIYNDIHGFIINQEIHQKTSKEFYLGRMFQIRGFNIEIPADKPEEYEKATTHYSRAIELGLKEANVYGNLGECWLHLEKWKKAMEDLTIAQDMGANIVAAFHNDYKKGPEEFKERTGIPMPGYIKVLLGH